MKRRNIYGILREREGERITRKWGRWQHQVDYSGFKNNRLIKRQGLEVLSGANNYGMKLAEIT